MKGLIDFFLYDYEENLLNLHSHGLLSDDEKMIISGAPTGLHRNWLLLQCFVHLSSIALLTFCQLVQQYKPVHLHPLVKGKQLGIFATNVSTVHLCICSYSRIICHC